MFATRKRPTRVLSDDILNEVRSICHSRQVSLLALPKALRRDTGTECGCEAASILTTSPW